ncbi:MAG: helix-turn-helix transcriptional regulator [Clostridia bacterium]|nr:helix-turn-helix transcriptional regulator [Clostridia bacterium]
MAQYSSTELSYHHTKDTPKSDSFHRHMHNGYELFYFVRGDAEYIIEGSAYRLRPGDLLFIHPRKFHYLNPVSDATYERFVIHFSIDYVPEELRDFVRGSNEIYRITKGSLAERFFATWSEVENLFSKEDLSEYLRTSLSSAILFIKYLPDESSVKPIRRDATLESILQYIDSHPDEQLSAESLSAKFYMSSSWIVHTFKKNLGISLMQYIQKKRVLYAEALIYGGTTPTEAAKLCNYESYSTFYRQYKKILGVSPMDTHKHCADA